MNETAEDRAFSERKPIKGYEGMYSVTSDGRVWSEERVVMYPNGHKRMAGSNWLTPFSTGNGYLYVNLSMPGRTKMFTIHRLVAMTFLHDAPKGMEIDHEDRNPKNNRLENLRYVTHTKNNINRYAKGCFFRKDRNRWQARLRWNGNSKIIGQFKTEEEAHAAYKFAKEQLLLIIK